MDHEGKILQILDNEVVVLTPQKGFVLIKKRSGMYVGQRLIFSNSEIINGSKRVVKYSAVISSVAAILVVAFLYFQSAMFKTEPTFAYIDIDINPSIEFVVDKNRMIIGTNPINADAEILLKELDLRGKRVDDALTEVIAKSKSYGFIDQGKENVILISAALEQDSQDAQTQNDDENLEGLLTNLKDTANSVDDIDVETKLLKAKEEDRDIARENNLSMGKIVIYLKAKEQNIDLSLEEVREGKLSDIIKKVPVDFIGETKAEPTHKPANVNTHTPVPEVKMTYTPKVDVAKNTAAAAVTVAPRSTNTPTDRPTETPVPTNTPTPVPANLIDDRDQRLIYSSGWDRVSNNLYHSLTASRSNTEGSSVQFTFTGSIVKWYGVIGNSQGKADIYIDDVLDVTVDCYSKESQDMRTLVYQKNGLPDGKHTIKIVVRGEKNKNALGSNIDIDAFQYD